MRSLPPKMRSFPPAVLVALALAGLTLAVYWPVGQHGFVNYDDGDMIFGNPHVRAGLTWEGVRWSFTAADASAFWHPLAWISHMADVSLFGLDAGWHHRVGLLIHLLNALLLFAVFRRATGATWRSGVVAALFAVHPLHVESVAWASERKDVLSAFFLFLTWWCHVRFTQRPGIARYLPVLLSCCLALMSKPMAVTLPFSLLLLDYWPLGRMTGTGSVVEGCTPAGPPVPLRRLLLEKAPLFVLSAAVVAVTLGIGIRHAGWMPSMEALPLYARIANALVAYATYVVKTVRPSPLAILYLHRAQAIPAWEAAGAALFLAAATWFAIRAGRRRPWLPFGWFLYLGMLVPVIGLVQAGLQGIADRYTYVPLVGLFVIVAWGAADLLEVPRMKSLRVPALAAGGAALLLLAFAARSQVDCWRDSVTLYRHALEVAPGNWLVHANLGEALRREGRHGEAVAHFLEAIRLNPGAVFAYENMAISLCEQGQPEQADRWFLEAIRLAPGEAGFRDTYGIWLLAQRRIDEAESRFREALQLEPDNPHVSYRLAGILLGQGKADDAIVLYRRAVRLLPGFADAHNDLGAVLARRGRVEEAVPHFRETLRLKPGDALARRNLDAALALDAGRGR